MTKDSKHGQGDTQIVEQAADALPQAPDNRRRSLLRAGLGVTLLPMGGSFLLSGCNGGGDDDDDDDGDGGTGKPQPALVSSFALAVLPDTQFYSRYATDAENQQFMRKYGSEPYQAQTRWVAEHAKALNIPFLVHLGDVVDQQGKPDQ
jgi:hypothetical protein